MESLFASCPPRRSRAATLASYTSKHDCKTEANNAISLHLPDQLWTIPQFEMTLRIGRSVSDHSKVLVQNQLGVNINGVQASHRETADDINGSGF